MASAFKLALTSPRALVLQIFLALPSIFHLCAFDGETVSKTDAMGVTIRPPGRSNWACDAMVQGVYRNASEIAAFNASCLA